MPKSQKPHCMDSLMEPRPGYHGFEPWFPGKTQYEHDMLLVEYLNEVFTDDHLTDFEEDQKLGNYEGWNIF